jgi:hypothetical protein
MRLLTLLTLLFVFPCFAEVPVSAHEHWERLQRMVKVGIITPEAADREKSQSNEKVSTRRAAAQRGLASVQPELHPLKVKRLRVPTMEVFLD